MNWHFASLLVSVILQTAGSLMVKHSASREDKFAIFLFLLGGGSFFLALMFHAFALKKISLSFAQPFVAGLVLMNVSLFGWFILREQITLSGVLGLVFVISGVALLSL